ncbi:hypothetical protein D3C79_893510 [compost metagenome]
MLAGQMIAVHGKLKLGILSIRYKTACIDIERIGGMKLGFTYRSLGQDTDAPAPGKFDFDNITGNKHIFHAQHPGLHRNSFAVEEKMSEIIEQIAFAVQLQGFDPVAGRQRSHKPAGAGHIRTDQLALAVHAFDVH